MGKADRLKKEKEKEKEEQTPHANQILSSESHRPMRLICEGELAMIVFELLRSVQGHSMASAVGVSPFKSWMVFCFRTFHRRLESLPQGIALIDVQRGAVDLCHKLTSEEKGLLFSGFRFSSVYSALSEEDKRNVNPLLRNSSSSCENMSHRSGCPFFSASMRLLFDVFLHCSPRKKEMCGPESEIGYHVKCNMNTSLMEIDREIHK